MHTYKRFVLILILALLTPTAAAAPLAGPCLAGGTYDPACDVDHDSDVDVIDIQLTAGHWNQTGTFTSDNDHNHLGQTWTGNNNPLVLQGSFGSPTWAPLILGNSGGPGVRVNAPGGSGVWVEAAGNSGVLVDSAANSGVLVTSAGNDGLFVCRTGTATTCGPLSSNNGVEIGNAEDDGVRVTQAGHSGLFVGNANLNGVDVIGSNYAGYFVGNIFVTGNCIGCLQANFAVNGSDRVLQPGDIVSMQSVILAEFDTGPALWQVTLAQPGQPAVGVVAGRAELVVHEDHRPGETGRRLVPREGAAQPGDYVTIVYSGPMPVKVAPDAAPVVAGTRLTAASDGTVRPLGTVKVRLADGSGTADLLETAPVIGIAITPASDGQVWVLVNPQ